jgi:hypothetical protein
MLHKLGIPTIEGKNKEKKITKVKRNAIMLQNLEIPTVKCKNKKKQVTEAEKGNETHTALVEKEKETTMWKKRIAMALPGVAEEALC